jgi:hypothetical protein
VGRAEQLQRALAVAEKRASDMQAAAEMAQAAANAASAAAANSRPGACTCSLSRQRCAARKLTSATDDLDVTRASSRGAVQLRETIADLESEIGELRVRNGKLQDMLQQTRAELARVTDRFDTQQSGACVRARARRRARRAGAVSLFVCVCVCVRMQTSCRCCVLAWPRCALVGGSRCVSSDVRVHRAHCVPRCAAASSRSKRSWRRCN